MRKAYSLFTAAAGLQKQAFAKPGRRGPRFASEHSIEPGTFSLITCGLDFMVAMFA